VSGPAAPTGTPAGDDMCAGREPGSRPARRAAAVGQDAAQVSVGALLLPL